MRKLIFTDQKTGETFEHFQDDWILRYCNFNVAKEGQKHPLALHIGQKTQVKDNKGHIVNIVCKRGG